MLKARRSRSSLTLCDGRATYKRNLWMLLIEAAWTDPNGVVHVYRSRYLKTDVTKLLKSDTVPVYIDRYNENIGFVDIDAVLPEIRIHN